MDVTFKDHSLDRLETDATFSAGFSDAVVKAYRRAMQHIRAASDERTLYARRSFRFEMRLNDQWRLVVELQGEHPKKIVHIFEIVDYH